MGEKFLVTSELNGSELLRSLALRGRSSFAFRVVTPAELAETALIRCGRLPAGKRVSEKEQPFVIGGLMQRIPWFSRAFSFQDAVRLTDTLNAMRMRFASEEADSLRRALPRGEFADKNSALLEIHDLYTRWLEADGRMDHIGLIRYAAEQAAEMKAEFLIPDISALSPLEKALVDRVSGGKAVSVSLPELFGAEASGTLRMDSLTEAYGPVNEADRLIRDICDAGVPMDRCVVAVTDPSLYGQLFYDLAMEKGLPVAFGCGIPVSDSSPAALLSLWAQWHETGFHGVDTLQAMLFSDAFDRSALTELLNQGRTEAERKIPLRRLTELAGSMRLEPDARINRERIDAWEKTLSESSEDLWLAEPLRRFGQELGLPCDAFLRKYANIRKHPFGGPLDQAALEAMLDTLGLPRRFPGLISVEAMIPLALSQTVKADAAEPGKLLVTTVSGALSAQREHLYLLGLSADKFPGKPRENALMLDSDWALLPSPETAPTSRRLVEESLERMTALVRLANSLGEDVHVFWPDYDPAALKELIPSSFIYRLLDECPEITPRKEGFFPAVYSDAYAISRLYLEGGRVSPEAGPRDPWPENGPDPEKQEWSPTAIDGWFGCKRQFLYQHVLRLDVPEKDDPMVIISPPEAGNLAHYLMEILGRERPGEAEFHALAVRIFEDYLTARPPMDAWAAGREKDRFVRMMDSAWRRDPRRETVLIEEDLHSVHPCGLRLRGRPDRVEADGNGDHIIVDFKTGRRPLQAEEDPASCRQALIYIWMVQQQGLPVSRCEYRYLRLSRDIRCGAGPDIMARLEEDLRLFYHGLESGDFAPEDGYGNKKKTAECKYCPYQSICDRDRAEEEAQA